MSINEEEMYNKTRMNIGILTFWQSQDNYGQILQCWALQKYLRKKGYNAFLIRYTHEMPKPLLGEQIKKIIKVYPVFTKIWRTMKRPISHNEIASAQNRHFDEFKKKYIIQSQYTYRNIVDLRRNPPQADCYIVGSDQVWAHLLNNKNNEVYYLNFGDDKIRRISYAASFAMEQYPTSLYKKLQKNLLRIDAISVRERSGISICANVGINAKLVLDPTLLLTSSDYMQFIDQDKVDSRYVFLYLINLKSKEEFNWNELKPMLQTKFEKIRCTTAKGYMDVSFHLGGCEYIYPSIEGWLSLLFNSSFVITSSFHGVAFSIIFNKPFIFIPLSGEYAKSNNRVVDLLSQIQLSQRILYDKTEWAKLLSEKIDWDTVNMKLQKLRTESRTFLDNSVSN